MSRSTPQTTPASRAVLLKKGGRLPRIYPLVELGTDGKKARPMPVDDGYRTLTKWQVRRYHVLAPELFRLLIAPMGAGKSTLTMALALHDRDQGHRQVIAVPKTEIGEGFDSIEIKVPGGSVKTWTTWARRGRGNEATVDELVRFIVERKRDGKSFVCTHIALVLAFDKILRLKAGAEPGHLLNGKIKGDPWKGTSLFLDEGHHSRQDGEKDNGIGRVVKHYISNKSGPLTLITATFLRTESTVVDPKHMPLFKRDPYPIDEYLEECEYLRQVRINFVVGPRVESFAALCATDPHRKTIVGYPLGMEPADKIELLRAVNKSILNLKLDVADLVTDNTSEAKEIRKARERQVLDAIKGQKKALAEGKKTKLSTSQLIKSIPSNTPDQMHVLKKFGEGADWPEASRAILLSPRGSNVDTLQFFGRLWRDWPGKTAADFYIILNVETGPTSDMPTKMGDYVKVILASMIIEWQFKRVHLLPKSKHHTPVADTLIGDFDILRRYNNRMTDVAFNEGDPTSHENATEQFIDELVGEHPELGDPNERARVRDGLDAHADFLSKQTRSRIKREAKEIPFDVQIREDILRGRYGAYSLWWVEITGHSMRELRDVCGRITLDEAVQKLFEDNKKAGVLSFRNKKEEVLALEAAKKKVREAVHQNGHPVA